MASTPGRLRTDPRAAADHDDGLSDEGIHRAECNASTASAVVTMALA
jgi:hypothetical protein